MVDFAESMWEDFDLKDRSLPERGPPPDSPPKRCMVAWRDLVCLGTKSGWTVNSEVDRSHQINASQSWSGSSPSCTSFV